MGLDYYGILRVKRNCNQSEVKHGYRKLALKYNPERHNEDDDDMKKIFSLISEAYEVLVNPLTRAVYDQYGEEGLKKGVPGPDGYIQPFVYHGQPERTYAEFFGTSNPYADLLDYLENPPPMFTSPLGKGYKEKDPAIIRPLALTLNEVYTGGLKKMKIQRLIFTDEKCDDLKLNEKILSIPFKPGIYPNTEIRFKEEGDQGPTRIPADVIFITEDRPHETYSRINKSDLLTVCDVTLREALTGTTVSLQTLDGRSMTIRIDDVITPTYEKVIEGEGLPLLLCPTRAKGDLFIRFVIHFPEYFSPNAKILIGEAFDLTEREAEAFDNEC